MRGGFELKKLVEVTEGVGGAYGVDDWRVRGKGGGCGEGVRPGTRIENSSHFVADDG